MYRANDQPVPGYTLVKRLGGGALGDVWRAVAPGGVSVAVKIVALRRSSIARELQGANRLKSINHPHLVSLSGIWLKDDAGRVIPLETATDSSPRGDVPPAETIPLDQASELIIAMDLCEKNLDDRRLECEGEGLPGIPRAELLKYLRQAAEAIDFLNKTKDIQHCDIKPANILLVGGGAQVCDYGLAEQWNDARATQDFAGTPAYAAPELLLRGRPSATTDQFSLAITYYELATGTLPYPEAASGVERQRAICNGRLDFSRAGASEAAVLRRATSRNPERRFASCEQFVAELARATTPPPPTTGNRRLATFAGRTCLVGSLLLLVLVVLDTPWRGSARDPRALRSAARRARQAELQAKADSAGREAARLEQEGAGAEVRLARWNEVIGQCEELAVLAASHDDRSGAPAEAALQAAYRQRAWLHFEMGNLALARMDLERITPPRPRDRFLLGACLLAAGDTRAGIRLLEEAVQGDLDPAQAVKDLLQVCRHWEVRKVAPRGEPLEPLRRLALQLKDNAAEPEAVRAWLALHRELTERAADAVDPAFQRAAIDARSRLIADSRNPAASDHAERLRLRLALLEAGQPMTLTDCYAAVYDAHRAKLPGPPPVLDACRLRWSVFSAQCGTLLKGARLPLRDCSPTVAWIRGAQDELSTLLIRNATDELDALARQRDLAEPPEAGGTEFAALYESGLVLLDLGRDAAALQRFDEALRIRVSAGALYHRALSRWGQVTAALAADPERAGNRLPEPVRIDLEAVIDDLTRALDHAPMDRASTAATWRDKAHLIRASARQFLGSQDAEAILRDLQHAASRANVVALVALQQRYLHENRYTDSVAVGRQLLRRPGWGWNGFHFQDDVFNFLALAMKETADDRRFDRAGEENVEWDYLSDLLRAQRCSAYALQTFYWEDLDDLAGSANNLLQIMAFRRQLRGDIQRQLQMVAALDGEGGISGGDAKRTQELANRTERAEQRIETILKALAGDPPLPEHSVRRLQSLAAALASHPDPALRGSLQALQLRQAGTWERWPEGVDRLAAVVAPGQPNSPLLQHEDIRCLLRVALWWGNLLAGIQRIRFERQVEELIEQPSLLASPWAGRWESPAVPCFRIARWMFARLPLPAGACRLANRLALQVIETSWSPGHQTLGPPWRTTPLDLLIAFAGR